MRPEDFKSGAAGEVRKSLQGAWTFVPNPLPPPINLSWELVRRFSEADRGLSELAGISRNLPNYNLLDKYQMILNTCVSYDAEQLYSIRSSGPGRTNQSPVRAGTPALPLRFPIQRNIKYRFSTPIHPSPLPEPTRFLPLLPSTRVNIP